MKGYTQINVIYASKLYRRPANQYESDSSMTNEVNDTKGYVHLGAILAPSRAKN